jgi:hypothetical protein
MSRFTADGKFTSLFVLVLFALLFFLFSIANPRESCPLRLYLIVTVFLF